MSEIVSEHICASDSKSTTNVAIFKDTDVSVPYKVSSELNNSMDVEQPQSFNDGSVNTSEHLMPPVIDKECDHNSLKDVWADDRVSSQNKNNFTSQDSLKLEDYKLSDSTHAKASDVLSDVSFERVAYQPDVDKFLDLDSLLNLAETGDDHKLGNSDHIVDKSYIDELLASSNNPFLEDSAVDTCRGDEKEAVSVSHPSNPFEFEGTLYEPEGNTNIPDENSKFSRLSDVNVSVTSSKNPFLDTSSFKLAKDDFEEAEKISGNGLTIDNAVKNELATHGDVKKTISGDKNEVPITTSTVNSLEAGEKMKIPGHSNGPVNGSQLQHDPLESSFASINPYPTLISHSGQIPFSGSMSLRSESSVASNRSFAFPVLQTEWKASPVRMAKAERKHNSWKHTLLCCNF